MSQKKGEGAMIPSQNADSVPDIRHFEVRTEGTSHEKKERDTYYAADIQQL